MPSQTSCKHRITKTRGQKKRLLHTGRKKKTPSFQTPGPPPYSNLVNSPAQIDFGERPQHMGGGKLGGESPNGFNRISLFLDHLHSCSPQVGIFLVRRSNVSTKGNRKKAAFHPDSSLHSSFPNSPVPHKRGDIWFHWGFFPKGTTSSRARSVGVGSSHSIVPRHGRSRLFEKSTDFFLMQEKQNFCRPPPRPIAPLFLSYAHNPGKNLYLRRDMHLPPMEKKHLWVRSFIIFPTKL